MLFNAPLEHAIRKVQENQVGLKFNGTHQLVAYADDVSKEVGLEVNVEKTKYMLVSLPLECRSKSWDIKIANRASENLPQFKYLGMTVINQNFIQGETKIRLNSGNACYHAIIHNLLSSRLLSKHEN
jgi:hypothetical protein